jgi:hypothetical protein
MNKFGFYSAGFSIVSMSLAFLVWVAGTHSYGALSRVWQFVDIEALLALSLSFAIASCYLLCRSFNEARSLFLFALFALVGLNVIQVLLLLGLVIVRIGFGVD